MWNSLAEEDTGVFLSAKQAGAQARSPMRPCIPLPGASCHRAWRRQQVRSAAEREEFLQSVAAAMAAAGYQERDACGIQAALVGALLQTTTHRPMDYRRQGWRVWCYVSSACVLARVEGGSPCGALTQLSEESTPPTLAIWGGIRYNEASSCATIWFRTCERPE
jgi:hypothetical protein